MTGRSAGATKARHRAATRQRQAELDATLLAEWSGGHQTQADPPTPLAVGMNAYDPRSLRFPSPTFRRAANDRRIVR